VTIAIASAGSSWSVTAHRGARVVVKKAPVTPGVVAAIAALLNESGVEDAVATVNDSALGEAEARADKLRAELAQVEAVLISHRRP
jgi:acyl-CoA reductase-like NAD-dependent aldehyde dehydrogenase